MRSIDATSRPASNARHSAQGPRRAPTAARRTASTRGSLGGRGANPPAALQTHAPSTTPPGAPPPQAPSAASPLRPPPALAPEASPLSALEGELACAVCLSPYTDAVTLHCGHNFCRACLTLSWGAQQAEQACPVCSHVAPREDLRTNHTLNNLVQMMRREGQAAPGPEGLCPQHQEECKLFCLDDKELICSQCQTSSQHQEHRLWSVPEAASDCRAKLKNMRSALKKKVMDLEDLELNCLSVKDHNKIMLCHTQNHIKKEFEELHEFLRRQEKAALSDLEEEAKQKQKLVDKQIKNVQKDLRSLSAELTKINSQMKENDVPFLMNLKINKRRNACTIVVPETLPAGLLIDVARHLGCLQYKVWKKMQNTIEVGRIHSAKSRYSCPIRLIC